MFINFHLCIRIVCMDFRWLIIECSYQNDYSALWDTDLFDSPCRRWWCPPKSVVILRNYFSLFFFFNWFAVVGTVIDDSHFHLCIYNLCNSTTVFVLLLFVLLQRICKGSRMMLGKEKTKVVHHTPILLVARTNLCYILGGCSTAQNG